MLRKGAFRCWDAARETTHLVTISLNSSLPKLDARFELVVRDGVVAKDEEIILLVSFAHFILHVPIVFASWLAVRKKGGERGKL